MKIYNTLSRQIETFTPLRVGQAGIYACGPTVYDQAHIGNMRMNIAADILVRTLRFLGYSVTYVMNITDIDDRMIERSAKERIPLSDLAIKYETIFFEDLAKLNIELADIYPRASEHYPEMKQLLNTLIHKGFAYEKDGEVYFDISKFKTYGRLSQLDKRQIKPGARVAVQNYDKDDVSDFALWKIDEATKGHEIETTKGSGRPGWHLECSAMSMKYLGPTIDIHMGGVDLIFPHHENEIAQSEAATEQPFARYFVHNEFIMVDNQKMAKSLGNYYTLADIEKKGIEPMAFRYLVLSTHYRSKLNFTWDSLRGAANTLDNIRQLAYRKTELSFSERKALVEEGTEALKDDLDTPKLLSILHQASSYSLWLEFEPVLGLKLPTVLVNIPANIKKLLIKREAAREDKNFSLSDKYRKQIEELGYRLEDTPTGSRLIPPS